MDTERFMAVLIIFFFGVITISKAAEPKYHIRYHEQIKECTKQNKYFSFDSLKCVDRNTTLNPKWKEFW